MVKYTVDTCGKSEIEAGASEWAGSRRALIATKRAQRRESSMGSFNHCEKEQDGFRTPRRAVLSDQSSTGIS